MEIEHSDTWHRINHKAQLFMLSMYMDYYIEYKWAYYAFQNKSAISAYLNRFNYDTKYITLNTEFTNKQSENKPMSFPEFAGWVEINLHLQSPACTILQ